MTSRLCGSLIITPRIILWGVGAAHFKCVMFYWENPSSAHIPTVPVNKKFTFRFKRTIIFANSKTAYVTLETCFAGVFFTPRV